MRSIGKSGFRFQNLDFGFPIEREIRKRISTLTNLFLDFHFCRSIGKSEKGFEKLSLRKAVLQRTHNEQKKKDRCSREQFCESFFGFPNRKVNRKSMKSGFGFLKKKSTLRTDFSEVKSVFGFRVRLGNPDLERTPSDSKIIGIKTYLFENFSRKKGSRKF